MDPEPEPVALPAPTPGTFPCPCCGYLVHEDGPGSFGICLICRWEDDFVQLRWPTYDGGANRRSLLTAQRQYLAAHPGALESGADALPGFSRDPGWRPLDPERDAIPDPDLESPWPDDRTSAYWWRPGASHGVE